jgi:hypothetical protein
MALVTSTLDSVIVVWHVAVNAGDADAAAAACTDDVEMTVPDGLIRGRDDMRDWVQASGIKLMPKEAYDVPGGIVVAQEATWPARPDTQPTRIYTAFGLRDGSICGVYPYGTLEEARAHPVAV